MDSELLALLKETVTRHPYSSTNNDNEYAYGASQSVTCRIEYTPKRILNDVGDEIVSVAQVYVNGTQTLDHRDKIVLPDGATPEIIKIVSLPDENGDTYYKCIFT
jgi:hypothetical protein